MKVQAPTAKSESPHRVSPMPRNPRILCFPEKQCRDTLADLSDESSAAATIRSGSRGRPTIGQDAPQEHGVPGHRSWTHTLEPFLRGRRAIHEAGFVEIVHADGLNGFREFDHDASVDSVMSEAKKCQTELHKWCKHSTQRRNPSTSCPTPNHTATPLNCSVSQSTVSSGWTCM